MIEFHFGARRESVASLKLRQLYSRYSSDMRLVDVVAKRKIPALPGIYSGRPFHHQSP
jgi:hypothetical protein